MNLQTQGRPRWRSAGLAGSVLIAFAAALVGCGGGGGGGETPQTPTNPPQPPVTVPSIVTPGDTRVAAATSFVTNVSGTGLTFAWDFGDGSTSTRANPSHAYAREGSYAVAVRVTAADGTVQTLKTTMQARALEGHMVRCEALAADSWCQTEYANGTARHLVVVHATPTVAPRLRSGDVLRLDAQGGASRVDVNASAWVDGRMVAHFIDPALGFAVEGGWVTRSSDSGQTWQRIYRGRDSRFSATKVIPAGAGRVLALSESYQGRLGWLFAADITLDRGATWQPTPFTDVRAVTADGTIWGFREGQLGRSRDAGATFEPVTTLPRQVYNMALAPDGSVVAMLPSSAGELVDASVISRDGGTSWTVLTPMQPPPRSNAVWGSVGVQPGGQRALAAYDYGREATVALLLSEDHAQSWREVALPASVQSEDPVLQVSQVDDRTLVAKSRRQMWLSSNRGGSWQAVDLDGQSAASYFARREADGSLWLDTSDGGTSAYASSDEGWSWRLASGGPLDAYALGRVWLFPPTSGAGSGRGIALSNAGLMRETLDGGRHWLVRQAVGRGGIDGRLLFVDATQGWLLSGGVIYRSRDAGRTWERHPSPPATSFELFDLQFVDAQNGFVHSVVCDGPNGECRQPVFATRDGGQTWATMAPPPEPSLYRSVMRWADARRGVLIDGKDRNWITQDGGATWQHLRLQAADGSPDALTTTATAVVFRGSTDGWLVGYDYDQLFRTRDGGASWVRVDLSALVDTTRPTFWSIHFDGQGRGWLRGSITGAIEVLAITTDDGATWRRP